MHGFTKTEIIVIMTEFQFTVAPCTAQLDKTTEIMGHAQGD